MPDYRRLSGTTEEAKALRVDFENAMDEGFGGEQDMDWDQICTASYEKALKVLSTGKKRRGCKVGGKSM